jgi:hypothetical protein
VKDATSYIIETQASTNSKRHSTPVAVTEHLPKLKTDDPRALHSWHSASPAVFVICVGCEVLAAAVINAAALLDIAPYSPYVNRRFGVTYHLHLQGKIRLNKRKVEE